MHSIIDQISIVLHHGQHKKSQNSVELSPPPAKKSCRAVIFTREATDPPVQESHRAAIDPAVQASSNSNITSNLVSVRSVMAKEVADQIDARPVNVVSAPIRPRDGSGQFLHIHLVWKTNHAQPIN